MNPRQACLACLAREPSATFEAALWIAAEHEPAAAPAQLLEQMRDLHMSVSVGLPMLPARELAQPLLRRLNELGYQQDDFHPLRPQAALMNQVLARKRGQPLALGLLALELARRLNIPLMGVNFPGHFLLQVPGADHLLDPCGGRRLYPADCRELLNRLFGSQVPLRAEHMALATPLQMLQRLSRNLRQLHTQHDQLIAALKDAERVVELGAGNASDYMARASLYQRLGCPQAERFDIERALLLSDDAIQRLRLTDRLQQLPHPGGSVH
ncbi:transglutaminase family protein [Pseudomonas typographi]|uniref:Tetratricopeptide repeat protein n=1 Tax=Pseudomonas typographi TaxID=2715964 RepID=A0ABR7YYT8_9PSED|nr:transglutaminase family protein [Pseudomonas typographi]MBD1550834.1 tetratricopeptide repeat protein [Pseudomonas typographi]MBD1587776.1 tetratricopeptide repeat protein [Pseudomonas typographi]MBD1598299.1 tetratricopeptide repeat protein [Pseudomonas typographi]